MNQTCILKDSMSQSLLIMRLPQVLVTESQPLPEVLIQ